MHSTSLVPPVSAGPDYPRWTETLRNGSQVLIRPIGHLDKAAERTFIEGLSDKSRRFRFLGAMRSPSEAMLERLTNIDFVHDVAFAAVVSEDAHERIVGISRYSTDAAGHSCECAVTVSDEWQEQGLGTVLMKHLIEVARARGIHTMHSIDAAQNIQFHDLAHFLGFQRRVDPDDASLVIHELIL